MKIAANRGNQLNAPENSINSLISAYTSGADVLQFSVQMTKDEQLVVCHDFAINKITGTSGAEILVKDLTLKQLRWGNYDFSEVFNPHGAANFRYYHTAKRMQIERLEDILDQLPHDIEKLIELRLHPSASAQMQAKFAGIFTQIITNKGLQEEIVVYSTSEPLLKSLKQSVPTLRIAVYDRQNTSENLLQIMATNQFDGVVLNISEIIDAQGNLSAIGEKLKQSFHEKSLRIGGILYPANTGIISKEVFANLSKLDFIWSVSTDSMIGVSRQNNETDFSWLAPKYDWLPKSAFEGTEINRDWFAFGYAKANRYCSITQNNGVKIELKKYDGYLPLPDNPDPVAQRLNELERRMYYVEKSWPFYSGGGVAIIKPILGDFTATVDYEMKNPMSQAQTLEMAVTNVDPAGHRATPPRSFRDMDAFYDPHGCPPYVGVEHDENDGYRINWNFGNDYDNNQYGSPVGDGNTPHSGTLRLQRRGSYFSAYYRNTNDAPYWICVGVVKNLSLNEVVYLRCAAKRWLQEDDENGGYYPVQENIFTFKNLHVTKPIRK